MQKVKALNRRAEEKFPLLKNVSGKDGTAVIKKKIMMLFVNATKRETTLLIPQWIAKHCWNPKDGWWLCRPQVFFGICAAMSNVDYGAESLAGMCRSEETHAGR